MHPTDERALLLSLTTAIAGGLGLIILARRANLPAIVLLLLGGVLFGPEGIGVIQPASLEGLLPVIVSLAIGLILFEGGLTLDLRGFSRGSNAITGLLTVGVLVTWLGSAAAARLCFGIDWSLALLAGSMVIVTGPTVIGPLLKRLQIEPKLHHILHWEAVLIDAIGVFVATLCFEWIAGHSGRVAVGNFGLRALSGAAVGAAGGFAIVFSFRRRWVPQNLLNAFALAAAVLIFGATEAIISHAGLLSVTVAGFIIGWRRPVELEAIRHFKAEITDLLIGMLFLLLASRLKLAQFHDFGWRGVILVAAIMLVVRPLNVLVSTLGTSLTWREKMFLAWIAPRGIVAASLASLFAIALAANPGSGATTAPGGSGRFLETFVYSVIVATVILQGFSAGWVARWLRVKRPDPTGWMIVNADAFGRSLARFIRDEAKLDVLLLDTNARLVAEARAEGLPALCENALNVELAEEHDEFQPIGNLLALTDNNELNELLCHRWGHVIGHEGTYRWSPAQGGAAPASKSGHGRVVFAKMARPSVIAAELMLREARVHAAPDDEVPFEGVPLLTLRGGEILPTLAPEDIVPDLLPVESNPDEPTASRVLVLERTEGFLSRSLVAGGVLDVAAGTLTDLYQQLIAYVVERNPAVSKEQMLRDTLEPTELVPAWLGHGVAIPHLYSSHLSHRVCVLARLAPPGLRTPEQQALRFVFFLVSPSGDPEGHLATLAEIARFCSEPEHREALAAFSSVADATRFVRSHSR